MAMHILLVDDETIVHQTLGEYLADCGHHVDPARDGHQALRAVEQEAYDVALVDVRMPGMDGLTLLTRTQQVRPQMDVIVMTGHGDPEMERQAHRLGAVGFLTKPIRLHQLDRLLAERAV
jgi:DNA-binding NtrC family response regulator